MKNKLVTVFLIAILETIVQARVPYHLRVLAKRLELLPPDALPNMIQGYFDGLLNVKFSDQMKNCDYFIEQAEENWDDAIDQFYMAADFWIPITKKIDHCINGFS